MTITVQYHGDVLFSVSSSRADMSSEIVHSLACTHGKIVYTYLTNQWVICEVKTLKTGCVEKQCEENQSRENVDQNCNW